MLRNLVDKYRHFGAIFRLFPIMDMVSPKHHYSFTRLRRNPDDNNFHSYSYENFKCRILILIYFLSFRFLSHIMWNVVLLSPRSKLLLELLTGQVTVIDMNVCLEEECVCMDIAASAFASKMSLGTPLVLESCLSCTAEAIDTYSVKL